MRSRSVLVVVVFVVVIASSLALAAGDATKTAPTNAAPVATTTSFRSSMDALAGLLASIVPEALARGPVDAARERRLRDGIVGLRGIAEHLRGLPEAQHPDADPTIDVLLGALSRSIDDVAQARADRLPATTLSLASTCIACHTRGAPGPHAPAVTAPLPADLAADVRADVLVASRRFAEARAAYHGVVFDEDFAEREPWRYERAVRRALALAVRVDGDAKEARTLSRRVLDTPGAEALWPAAEEWTTAMDAWSRETTDKALGNERAYATAQRMVAQATTSARVLGDAGAEIAWLRATAALHKALAGDGGGLSRDERAQALAWLGLAYERLPELDVWGVFFLYDAACVEAAPHTALARDCFARYERAARETWSGNSGAPLPDDVQKRVDELRALARRAAK
jgi:hypothetical protein